MVIFISWALFGAAACLIAKNKNRNSTLWCILGVLFGVFALIAVAVMPSLPAPPV